MAARTDPALLLYPGASAGRDQSALVAIDHAASGATPPWQVVRADFPYRREGRKAPDRAPKLMAAVREELVQLGSGPVVVGGRSMGGRICSMIAAGADGEPIPIDVIGLSLVSYPLHPPGKADRLRVEHLPDLHVPCLFVHGTRDPFGSPDELTEATAAIPGAATHVWIDGGRHDLRGADTKVATAVVNWLATFR